LIIWLDNHLSPALAQWIATSFGHTCLVVRDMGLSRAPDTQIFDNARAAGAILITKDADFAELVDRRGAPPAIVLLTCGNTSTTHLKILLADRLPAALALVEQGERLVEIGGDR
jgi:predicted nuclease of predicted toxin-antitoxin system